MKFCHPAHPDSRPALFNSVYHSPLAPVLPFFSAALGAAQALNTIASGKSQQRAYNYQAAQVEQQAGQERATAQRAAIEERRAARLALSKGRAIAAASGTDPLSVSTVDIQGDVAAQGEYDALAQLFSGEERALGLETQAGGYRTQGKITKQAGFTSGIGGFADAGATLANSGETLFTKYGYGKPGIPTAGDEMFLSRAKGYR